MVVISTLVALVLLLPVALLVIQAASAGGPEVARVLFRERSLTLLVHTVLLAVLVTVAAALIGVAAAWCTERTLLPARRLWTVLLVLPVAIPDFVAGYAWHTILPTLDGLVGATLVMTLGTYPLVYLPVAAALRRTDPAAEESALSLGVGRVTTFRRVTLPSIRIAILGGCVLVALATMAEYGAFEILRFQTFTTEIFTEFQFDQPAAAALSIPLVLLAVLVLGIDAGLVRRGRPDRVAPRRAAARAGLRRAAGPVLIGLAGLVILGTVVPIGTLLYWVARGQHSTLPAAATLAEATWATLRYSLLAAAGAVVLALPVAFMGFRRSNRPRTVIERSTYLTQALPGVVVALGLVFLATHVMYSIYHTSLLLVGCLVILHFSLAFVCVKTSVSQAPARLVDVGRSLGRGRLYVFGRITVPLILPGMVAGFCLVFLTAVTELTATLVLAPIGVETLTTQFWAYQSEAAYGAAAPYALVIIALAAVPGALLVVWFDRQRHSPIVPT